MCVCAVITSARSSLSFSFDGGGATAELREMQLDDVDCQRTWRMEPLLLLPLLLLFHFPESEEEDVKKKFAVSPN